MLSAMRVKLPFSQSALFGFIKVLSFLRSWRRKIYGWVVQVSIETDARSEVRRHADDFISVFVRTELQMSRKTFLSRAT
jgi:hypothetical protein